MTLPTPSSGTAPIQPGTESAELPPPTSGRPGRRPRGQAADIWRRYRRNKLAMLGLAIVSLLVFVAIFEPVLTPYDPFEQNLLNVLQPPSAQHWFGTDVLGRDLYSGVVYGTRLAMIVGVLTMLGSLVIGVTLGAVAGF